PNGKCYMHGGRSPGGPLTAGGRYSKFLPVRLAARYAEARDDPELVSLADDLAVLEVRLGDLPASLTTRDAGAARARGWELFQTVMKGGDEARTALRDVGLLLRDGAAEADTWREIAAVMEQRRRLAEAEVKRLAALQQFLSAQQANRLIGA